VVFHNISITEHMNINELISFAILTRPLKLHNIRTQYTLYPKQINVYRPKPPEIETFEWKHSCRAMIAVTIRSILRIPILPDCLARQVLGRFGKNGLFGWGIWDEEPDQPVWTSLSK